MTKAQKLKICDWSLAIPLPIVLVSSIQLEATSSGGVVPVIFHIIIALPFMCIIVWHISLHFQYRKWFTKFSKVKVPTRILWWLYILTFISGVATFIHAESNSKCKVKRYLRKSALAEYQS